MAGITLASCNTASTKLSFKAYWNTSTEDEYSTPINEKFTYDVSYSYDGKAKSYVYCVDQDGNQATDEYVVTVEGKKTDSAYEYTLTQELTLPITFTLEDGSKETKYNKMTSYVIFSTTYAGLRPIASWKWIQSYTPKNGTFDKIENCYTYYDYTTYVVYNGDGNQGEVVLTDLEGTFLGTSKENCPKYKKSSFEIGTKKATKKYTYLDNEQLFFALRGLSNSQMKASQKINCYDEAMGSVRQLALTANKQDKTTEFKTATIEGVAIGETAIAYNSVNLAVDAKNSGGSYELWYAQEGAGYRNALLKVNQTLASVIGGTLTYTLTSIDW